MCNTTFVEPLFNDTCDRYSVYGIVVGTVVLCKTIGIAMGVLVLPVH